MTRVTRSFMIAGLFFILLGASGCTPSYMRKAEGPARVKPPAGKVLVNFLRPTGYGGGVEFLVWVKYTMIGNT